MNDVEKSVIYQEVGCFQKSSLLYQLIKNKSYEIKSAYIISTAL